MAIALDATAVSADVSATPINWNHTCTGGNGFLIVGLGTSSATTQASINTVTYGGVSMVKVATQQFSASTALCEVSIWVLHNPLQGVNQISVTATQGATWHVAGASASYTGVMQSDAADATNIKTGNATGDQTLSVTTVKDNSWIFLIGMNVAGTGPTMTADQTSRGTVSMLSTIPSLIRASDTNAAQTPQGAKTVGMTTGATVAEDGYGIAAASFAPASVGTQLNDYQSASASDSNAGILSVTERVK